MYNTTVFLLCQHIFIHFFKLLYAICAVRVARQLEEPCNCHLTVKVNVVLFRKLLAPELTRASDNMVPCKEV